MKATVYGLLAALVALMVLAMPMKALAHEHHGWHHDNGNHWGWYKHRGGDGGYGYGGNPGYWHHHDHEWYEHHGYGGYGYGYNGYPGSYGYGGYPGNNAYGAYPGNNAYGAYPDNTVCDEDGDDCQPVPPMSLPWPSGYPGPGSYYGSGYNGSSYAPNAGKLMQLQQTMSQRLYANQALYQAAMAQGNYPLANKAATRMQNQSATISAANAMLGGAAAPGYPAYNQPAYGASPYYGQSGASPLGSILQMLGY
jgi:hypothetical protein